jgi:glycine cleavage system H protein
MKHTLDRRHDWLRTGAALLLVFIALPILAVLMFFARFVVLAAAIGALAVGFVLCASSARCRNWLFDLENKEVAYKGLRLAKDVALAPFHAWVRRGRDGAVVGCDDVAPTVLGPVSSVELPPLGQWFRRGEPIVWLRRGSRRVALRAPVSGVVVARNEALHWRPELVNDEPYADGWLVRLHSESAAADRGWLRERNRARDWFRSEVDRLVGLLTDEQAPVRAVADGGPLVRQVYREIDEPTWQRLSAGFFDARADRGEAAVR